MNGEGSSHRRFVWCDEVSNVVFVFPVVHSTYLLLNIQLFTIVLFEVRSLLLCAFPFCWPPVLDSWKCWSLQTRFQQRKTPSLSGPKAAYTTYSGNLSCLESALGPPAALTPNSGWPCSGNNVSVRARALGEGYRRCEFGFRWYLIGGRSLLRMLRKG